MDKSIMDENQAGHSKIYRQTGFWVILVIALSLRISAAFWWQNQADRENVLFRFGDSHSYWTLAQQITQGKPYQYGSVNASIFRAPVYPVVLASVAWIEDQRTAVLLARMIGCILGTTAVAVVMVLADRISQRLSDTKPARLAALLAGVLAAGYPGAIGMSVTILSEAIFCPLMMVQFWMIDIALSLAMGQSGQNSAAREKKLFSRSGMLAGLCAAAAILARPSWLLFMPMQATAIILFGPRQWQLWKWLFVCGIAAGVAMSPWWVRNAMITGKFVPTTLQVGPSLYDGLHPGATGASDEGMEFVNDFVEQQRLADLQANGPLESTFEYRLNRRMSQAALQWAWENPYPTAWLAVVKFGRTWSLWPSASQLGSPLVRFAETASTIIILSLAMIGSLIAVRKSWNISSPGSCIRWRIASLWMPTIYFTLLHMIFIGSVRYRQPAILVLTCVAGTAIFLIFQCMPKGQTQER